MSKNNMKILAGAAVLQMIVAVAKAKVSSPDGALEAVKSDLAPMAVNLLGLGALLYLVNK